jgi:hypothetical protein
VPIGGSYLYDVKSTEILTQYLNDGVALAALVMPTAAPVVATMDEVLASKVGTDLTNAVNQAYSGHTSVAAPLVDNINNVGLARKTTFAYDISVAPVNRNQVAPRTASLATMFFTVDRSTTLLGRETTGLPEYGGPYAVRNAQIETISRSSLSPQLSYVYNLLNANPIGCASNVENLTSNDTPGTVKNYCKHLRTALRNLGFNTYDGTVFLWSMYSESQHAWKDDFTHKVSDCLDSSEMNLVEQLHLENWISVQPPSTSTLPAAGVPAPAAGAVAPPSPAAAPSPVVPGGQGSH